MMRIEKEEAVRLKEKSRLAFDQQTATYDDSSFGAHARSLYPEVVRRVSSAAEQCGAVRPLRILDVGCGTGALSRLVLDALPGCDLAGIDISKEMLDVATRRVGGRARLVLGDSEHLPFHDGEFDIVYCCDSFHHYPDPRRAAFEMWRVLRPGGVLVVADCWQPAPVRAAVNAFLPLSTEGDVRMYSEAEMRDILGTWFGDVEWRRVGMGACIAQARK